MDTATLPKSNTTDQALIIDNLLVEDLTTSLWDNGLEIAKFNFKLLGENGHADIVLNHGHYQDGLCQNTLFYSGDEKFNDAIEGHLITLAEQEFAKKTKYIQTVLRNDDCAIITLKCFTPDPSEPQHQYVYPLVKNVNFVSVESTPFESKFIPADVNDTSSKSLSDFFDEQKSLYAEIAITSVEQIGWYVLIIHKVALVNQQEIEESADHWEGIQFDGVDFNDSPYWLIFENQTPIGIHSVDDLIEKMPIELKLIVKDETQIIDWQMK